MKKWIATLLALSMSLLLLAGCGNQQSSSSSSSSSSLSSSDSSSESSSDSSSSESQSPSSSDSSSEPVATKPTIAMQVQEYIGDNVIEIPKITGISNENVDLINQDFELLKANYETFDTTGVEWWELKTYPSTTDQYLNIVITSNMLPTYGTQGNVSSWNYDYVNDKYVSVEDALTMANLTKEELSEKFDAQLAKENEKNTDNLPTAIEFEVTAFRILADGKVELFCEVDLEYPQADTGTNHVIYTYSAADDAFTEMQGQTLIDAATLDQMDPPLFYAQEHEAQ